MVYYAGSGFGPVFATKRLGFWFGYAYVTDFALEFKNAKRRFTKIERDHEPRCECGTPDVY